MNDTVHKAQCKRKWHGLNGSNAVHQWRMPVIYSQRCGPVPPSLPSESNSPAFPAYLHSDQIISNGVVATCAVDAMPCAPSKLRRIAPVIHTVARATSFTFIHHWMIYQAGKHIRIVIVGCSHFAQVNNFNKTRFNKSLVEQNFK